MHGSETVYNDEDHRSVLSVMPTNRCDRLPLSFWRSEKSKSGTKCEIYEWGAIRSEAGKNPKGNCVVW